MRDIKIAVLGSTKGTDMQAIIDAHIPIAVVISNKQDAYILQRAKKYNIPAVFISSRGKSREEYDQMIMQVLEKYHVKRDYEHKFVKVMLNSFIEFRGIAEVVTTTWLENVIIKAYKIAKTLYDLFIRKELDNFDYDELINIIKRRLNNSNQQ